MPEFRYYSTFEEAIAILRDVVANHGLKIIPEVPALTEPHLAAFDRVEPEVVEQLARFGSLDLEGTFTRHPLEFVRRSSGPAVGTYYRDESVGPRLQWTLPGSTGGQRPTIGPGSIGYLTAYRDPATDEREPAPPELQDAFREVVKTIKKHLVNVVIRGEKVWVGRDTKCRFDNGELVIDP